MFNLRVGQDRPLQQRRNYLLKLTTLPIKGDSIKHYKIAGPTDTYEDNILFLPYWLLTYEEMLAMLLDRGDQNAPNQAMLFSRTVLKEKKSFLSENGREGLADNITIDSPVPYNMNGVLDEFKH